MLRFVATVLAWAFLGTPGQPLPMQPGLTQFEIGPAGGMLLQAVIPNPAIPWAPRPTVVYLPPSFSVSARYPVLYLLHGFPGSPYQFADGLRLAQTADRMIAAGSLRPFIAVIPPAGLDVRHGDWAGPWEDYLVQQVLPWVDGHLPVLTTRSARLVAGLSSGAYGALDIALRHPLLFGTVESWSGYFRPLREASLANADAATLAAHDPVLLVYREAPLLRSLGTRFFLSAGSTRDRATARNTKAFSDELRALGLSHELWLAPGGHDGDFWRRQLPFALRFALAHY